MNSEKKKDNYGNFFKEKDKVIRVPAFKLCLSWLAALKSLQLNFVLFFVKKHQKLRKAYAKDVV